MSVHTHTKAFINLHQSLLDDVKDFFVPVQPQVMVWDGHRLESDLFGILEVGIRPPDAF